jgi:hypothetical protein
MHNEAGCKTFLEVNASFPRQDVLSHGATPPASLAKPSPQMEMASASSEQPQLGIALALQA